MKFTAAALLLFAVPSLYAQKLPADRSSHISDLDPFSAVNTSLQPNSPSSPRPANLIQPVSARELLIPPKAIKELQRSRKAFDSGDLQGSNDHLVKALRIYPDFVEAHYNLGGNYLRQHEYGKGLYEFDQLVAINPNFPLGHHARAAALFLLHRYPEAELAARQALELEPESVDHRYMLATAIVAQGAVTPEAKTLLRQSEEKFPNASLVLAQTYLQEGKIDDVVTELQAYLRAPSPDNKNQAECWVALLSGVATGTCAANKTFPDFR